MKASELQAKKPTRFVSSLPDNSEETIELLRMFEGHFEIHKVLDEESGDEKDKFFYQYKVSVELLEFISSPDGEAMRRFLKESRD